MGFSLCLMMMLCSAPAPEQAQAKLVRGPYLQSLLDTSVVIVWTTSAASLGKVQYGAEGGPVLTVEDEKAATLHRLKLTGLDPGTVYRYQVFDSEDPLTTGDDRFRTSPPPGEGAIRLAVAGDTGSGDKNQADVAAVIEGMAPDLFIHTGDLIYIASPDQAIFIPYKKILANACMYPVMGNHADSQLDWPNLFSLPMEGPRPGIYYSFDWGNAHFVALDTENGFIPGSGQMKWAEADLSAAKTKGLSWTIVFFHRAAYDVGEVWAWDAPRVRQVIAPLVDRFEVDLVLMGHSHNYQRMHPVRADVIHDAWQSPDFVSPRSTIWLVTGGGGGQLYAEDPKVDHRFTERFRSSFHALQVDITSAQISVQAISSKKEVLDSFTIRKGEPRPDPRFVRSDTDMNGTRDLTDVIALVDHLFRGPPLPCPGMADIDLSGEPPSVTDAIYLIYFLYFAGDPPAPPFPECGTAPVPDDAWCMKQGCE